MGRDRQRGSAFSNLVTLALVAGAGTYGYDYYRHTQVLTEITQQVKVIARDVKDEDAGPRFEKFILEALATQPKEGVTIDPGSVRVEVAQLTDETLEDLPTREREEVSYALSRANAVSLSRMFFVTVTLSGEIEGMFEEREFTLEAEYAAGPGVGRRP